MSGEAATPSPAGSDSSLIDDDLRPTENRFRLEALEPRILLSADPISGEFARVIQEGYDDNGDEDVAAIIQDIGDVAGIQADIQADSIENELGFSWPEGWDGVEGEGDEDATSTDAGDAADDVEVVAAAQQTTSDSSSAWLDSLNIFYGLNVKTLPVADGESSPMSGAAESDETASSDADDDSEARAPPAIQVVTTTNDIQSSSSTLEQGPLAASIGAENHEFTLSNDALPGDEPLDDSMPRGPPATSDNLLIDVATTGGGDIDVSAPAVDAVLAQALAYWQAYADATGDATLQTALSVFVLGDVTIVSTETAGAFTDPLQLATAALNTITLDADAAGYGWFIDGTPDAYQEFSIVDLSGAAAGSVTVSINADGSLDVAGLNRLALGAAAGSLAEGKVDLLTVLIHELGHLLGQVHGTNPIMDPVLSAGQRILPGQATDTTVLTGLVGITRVIDDGDLVLTVNGPNDTVAWILSAGPAAGSIAVQLDATGLADPIVLEGFDELGVLNAGTGADDFRVEASFNSPAAQINAGSGNDRLLVKEGSSFAGFNGGAVSVSELDTVINRGGLAVPAGLLLADIFTGVENFIDNALLFVHGFGGTLGLDTGNPDRWLLNVGLAPDELILEPLQNSYDDILATLQNIGYDLVNGAATLAGTLVNAMWDWRVPVAESDATANGTLENATWSAISSSLAASPTFDTALDYLVYWMDQALTAWENLTGSVVDVIDIITHSTGGLVAKSYLQSAAYANRDSAAFILANPNAVLPDVNTLIQVGVPNQGSGSVFNLLNNDFSVKQATRVLQLSLGQAWDRYQADATSISGPDGNPLLAAGASATEFIAAYVGALEGLLAVYPFIDRSEVVPAITDLQTSPGPTNDLLNDLNAVSTDAFIAGTTSTHIVFGTGENTADTAVEHDGFTLGAGTSNEILEIDDFLIGSLPSGTWYSLDNVAGDGTVAQFSSSNGFTASANVTLNARPGIEHTNLVNDEVSQQTIVQRLLGLAAPGEVPLDLMVNNASPSTLETATRLVEYGILRVAPIQLGGLTIALTPASIASFVDFFDSEGDKSVTFAGSVEFDQFFSASGSFTITKQIAPVSVNIGGLPTGPVSVSATSWTLEAIDVSAFAGVGGPYESDAATPDAAGLSIVDLDLGAIIYTTPLGKFYALKASAASAGIVGVDAFDFSGTGISVELNSGSVPGSFVDFSGGSVPVGVFSMDFDSPLVSASADNVLLRISEYIYVSGGFRVSKGPVEYVDVETGLLNPVGNTTITGLQAINSSDDTQLGASSDGSMIWNLPIRTLEVGLENVDVFVGYTDGAAGVLEAAAANGELTRTELEDDAGAIGVFLDEADLGMLIGSVVPQGPGATAFLNTSLLKFFALQGDTDLVGLLGVPGVDLSATNLQVRVNQGSGVGLGWGPGLATPVIDFVSSFPTNNLGSSEGDVDNEGRLDGYRVATNTTGDYKGLYFDDSVFGVSSDRVLLRISEYVYVSGGFSFNVGGSEAVDVRTGLLNPTGNTVISGLQGINNSDDTLLGASSDGSMIWNLPIRTLEVGLENVDVFVGYTDGAAGVLEAAAANGELTRTELEDDAGAIGVFLDEADLGMLIGSVVPQGPGATAFLNTSLLKFFALQGDTDLVGLLGVPGVDLSATNLQVRVNQGSGVGLGWGPGLATPVIDFVSSFPTNNLGSSEGDVDNEGRLDGYRVATNTTGDYKGLYFDDSVFGVSSDRVLLRISEYVYVSGGFSFNVGGSEAVDVRTGLLNPTGNTVISGLQGINNSDDTLLGASSDGSMIWNLPIRTLEVGLENVDVFVGYTDGAAGVLEAAAANGELTRTELEDDAGAIGVFLDEADLGMLIGSVVPQGPGATAFLNTSLLKFFALQGDTDLVGLLGVPGVDLSATNLQVRVNQGSGVGLGWGPGLATPVIDFVSSFPTNNLGSSEGDVDNEGRLDGYRVATNTTGDYKGLYFDDSVFGVSSDRVLLRISEYVYVSGGFSFNVGGSEAVDVRTGLLNPTGNTVISGLQGINNSDDTLLGASSDGSMIWNLPIRTLEVGLENVDVFVGYTDGAAGVLEAAAANGELTRTELEDDAGAIGVFLDEADLGMLIGSVVPQGPGATAFLNTSLLKFFALQGDTDLVGLLGVPGVDLSATNLQVRVNQGSGVGLGWGPGLATPVIDFVSSFPTNNLGSSEGDVDNEGRLDGYRVATNTTGDYKGLYFDDSVFGVSSDRVLLRISDFVYVSGGFSFNVGGSEAVDVQTGLMNPVGNAVITGLQAINDSDDTQLGASSDGSMIWNLPIRTLEVGLENVDVFVGYTDGAAGVLEAAAANGELTESELEGANAIGVFVDEANMGMLIGSVVPQLGPTSFLNASLLKFFALQAHADFAGLIGVPELVLEGTNIEVRLNQGSGVGVGWGPGLAMPVIDFVSSFPTNNLGSTVADIDGDTFGYRVMTNTSGAFEALKFDSQLIAAGAENITIRVSEFMHLTGSFFFEQGPTINPTLAPGIFSDPTDVADAIGVTIDAGFLGTDAKAIRTLTVGASDVHAFVGLNGPYWVDSSDGSPLDNGMIDRNADGTIVTSEVNNDAIGLVIDDLDFGFLLGTPVDITDPIRYAALNASAETARVVGLEDEGVTAQADDILIQLNLSSPALGGLPILPVIDFTSLDPINGFGVKTGAKNADGSDVTVNLVMDTPLIAAEVGLLRLDLFGVVALAGSFAFELGPTVTGAVLTNGDTFTAPLTTMTIGASNVFGFVGWTGDGGQYFTDAGGGAATGNDLIDTDTAGIPLPGEVNATAKGIALNNLNVGLFLGFSADALSPGLFLATDISIASIGVVGLDSFLSANASLDLELNVGGGINGLAAINFLATFPDSDGTGPDAAGLEVNTGEGAPKIPLTFDTPLVSIEIVGELTIANVVAMDGAFFLETDGDSFKLFAIADLEIGPDIGSGSASLLDISSLGVVVINESGFAADLAASLDVRASALDLTVDARVIINTTGAPQTLTVPPRLVAFLNASSNPLAADAIGRFVPGTSDYLIPAGAPIFVNADTTPNLAGARALLGIGSATINYAAPGAYAVAVLDGTFNVVGFASASGTGAIALRSGAFELVVDLDFNLAGLAFNATGALGLYSNGITVNANVGLNVTGFAQVIDLNLNGSLIIDTRPGATKVFELDLDGSLTVLRVLTINGNVRVEVFGGGAWTMHGALSMSAGFPGLSLNISAVLDLNSDGEMRLILDGAIVLGPSGFNITGTAYLDIQYWDDNGMALGGSPVVLEDGSVFDKVLDVEGHLTVTGTLFYIPLPSVTLGVSYNSATGYITVRAGPVPVPGIAWATVDLGWFGTARVPYPTIEMKYLSFTVGNLKLGAAPPEPVLGSVNAAGLLTLNVGSQANRDKRNLEGSEINEDVIIEDAGAGDDGDPATRDIKVTMFGRSVVYEDVTSIYADMDDGNDTFLISDGVRVPVEVHLGSGNDTLNNGGSITDPVSGSVTPPLSSSSTFTVEAYGDDGADFLRGGRMNDQLFGGDGEDTIEGGLGQDEIDGGRDSDVINWAVGDGNDSPVSGGNGSSITGVEGKDTLNIVGTSATENVTISGNGSGFVVNVGAETLSVTGVEIADVDGRSGGDVFTVNDLTSSDLSVVNLRLGADSVQDQVVVNGLNSTAPETFDVATGTVVLDPGTTTVPPTTAAALQIVKASAVTVNVMGVTTSSGNDTVRLNTLGGVDTINVRSTMAGAVTTIDSGNGSDNIVVGSNVANTPATSTPTGLDGIDSAVTIIGGLPTSGSDWLYVDDTNGVTGDVDGVLTFEYLTGLGLAAGGINYSGIEHLVVTLGGGADVIRVDSTHSAETILNMAGGNDVVNVRAISGPTIVNGGGGSDTTNVGSAAAGTVASPNTNSGGHLGGIAALLTVNGNETASDTLNVDDTGNSDTTVSSTLTLDALTSTSFGSGGSIDYGSLENLNINLGAGADTFNVVSTSVLTTVKTGAGTRNNTVNVGSEAPGINGTVDQIDGKLHVVGQSSGTDTINVDETGETSEADVEVAILTNSVLTGLGMAGNATDKGIQYTSVDALNINLGSAADTFNVRSTSAATITTLRTGTGGADNVVNIGSQASLGNVNGIAGKLYVIGQSTTGTDTLNVDETGDNGTDPGTLTGSVISGLDIAANVAANGIDYSGFDDLNIDLGTGNDTFTIESTHGGTTHLDAGDGDDVVNIKTIQGITTVAGGSHSDHINVGSNAAGTQADPENNSGGTLDDIDAALTINGNDPDTTTRQQCTRQTLHDSGRTRFRRTCDRTSVACGPPLQGSSGSARLDVVRRGDCGVLSEADQQA